MSGQLDGRSARLIHYNECLDCPCASEPNRTDAENCEACCEHLLCVFHEGVEVGEGETIKAAMQAWSVS